VVVGDHLWVKRGVKWRSFPTKTVLVAGKRGPKYQRNCLSVTYVKMFLESKNRAENSKKIHEK